MRSSRSSWTPRAVAASCCALSRSGEEQERSQTAVAAAMETSQSAVARLESTASDAKISTIDRYAARLGHVVQYH